MVMNEKTISEFLNEMTEAGFSFDFRATNGEQVYVGSAKDGVLKSKKQLTAEELKQRITSKLNNGMRN
jgi:hypothetical protein